jgi:hypothetical protein
MTCIVDTQLLAAVSGMAEDELLALLPAADPLLLNDFDQQDHPFSVSVSPGDLAELPERITPALEGWWSMWRDMQLSHVERYYAEDAVVDMPGRAAAGGRGDVFDWCSKSFVAMKRRFCQPEAVLVDSEEANNVAILWNVEGDLQHGEFTRRTRIPVITRLEFQAGLIVRDTTLIDGLAARKWLMS